MANFYHISQFWSIKQSFEISFASLQATYVPENHSGTAEIIKKRHKTAVSCVEIFIDIPQLGGLELAPQGGNLQLPLGWDPR